MPESFQGSYRFDEFELNPSGRTLIRNGEPVAVSPKAFEVLTYLVANPGRVVTKDELLKTVWPDSFVEESNLAQHISWLRKAFGQKSNYIVTVPGRGYQFTAKVQAESSTPASFPEAQAGDILVQRVRERTHMVIEESSPAPLPDASPSDARSLLARRIYVRWIAGSALALALVAVATLEPTWVTPVRFRSASSIFRKPWTWTPSSRLRWPVSARPTTPWVPRTRRVSTTGRHSTSAVM
jgi:DNA-binding winged helix-turn-helix (wHTH) protein